MQSAPHFGQWKDLLLPEPEPDDDDEEDPLPPDTEPVPTPPKPESDPEDEDKVSLLKLSLKFSIFFNSFCESLDSEFPVFFSVNKIELLVT